VTYTPAPTQQPQPQQQRPTSGLAIAALLTGIFFWPAGIILSPIALSKIRKTGDGGRGLALAGLIISIVALIGTVIAIIVSVIAASVVVGAGAAAVDSMNESIDSIGAVDQSVTLGETGTTAEGVAFTLNSLNCGIPTVGNEYLNVTAQGQFCEANVTVRNNGTEPFMFSDSYAKGFIAETEYAADSSAGIYAPENEVFFTEINPGNEIVGKVFFDIPADAALERITLAGSLFEGVVEIVL
jgi:hypothetical protein